MAVFELEEHGNALRAGTATPTRVQPEASSLPMPDLAAEIKGYLRTMQEFPSWDSADVLMALSSMAARVAEIRSYLVEDGSQRATAFRTKQVDPFLEQCEFQFKCHSRRIAIHEMEFRMSGGIT